MTQKISPFLWFDKEAHAAAEFYCSVFPGGKITHSQIMNNTPSGTVEVVAIEIMGQTFTLMSAGPMFKFSEAISFVIACKDQAEIDYYSDKLSAVPESEQCGWVKDKYGLSWQITPENISELTKSAAGTQAMMKMKRINIAELERASKE